MSVKQLLKTKKSISASKSHGMTSWPLLFAIGEHVNQYLLKCLFATEKCIQAKQSFHLHKLHQKVLR